MKIYTLLETIHDDYERHDVTLAAFLTESEAYFYAEKSGLTVSTLETGDVSKLQEHIEIEEHRKARAANIRRHNVQREWDERKLSRLIKNLSPNIPKVKP